LLCLQPPASQSLLLCALHLLCCELQVELHACLLLLHNSLNAVPAATGKSVLL
jgi:hypothetical protein